MPDYPTFRMPDYPKFITMEDIKSDYRYSLPLSYFEISTRTSVALSNDLIDFVGELVQCSRNDILRTPNLARKSLNEVVEVLGVIGLGLDVTIKDPLPKDEFKQLLSSKAADAVA